ncbi:hypothetical protein ACW4YW_15130 [Methylobacillus pratensis]
MSLFQFIQSRLMRIAESRMPDVVIGGRDDPYLLRWYVIPRNRFFNVYLHKFMRSDDDRALHDHPWMNMSILLQGRYTEHLIQARGIHERHVREVGHCYLRLSGKIAHRVELTDGPCWTLFVTGPRYREWGFHCPEQGWVHWEDFTASNDRGAIGRGCGE